VCSNCHFSSTNIYTLGSETELDLRVVVENRGDDAFEAVNRIFIPLELEYINVELVKAPVSSSLHHCIPMIYCSITYYT